MSLGPELDDLTLRWSEQPTAGLGAALADGLGKYGALADALKVASEVVARWPGYLPGHLASARVARLASEMELARDSIAAALLINPGHPLARELAREWAPELLVDTVLVPEPDKSTGAMEPVQGALEAPPMGSTSVGAAPVGTDSAEEASAEEADPEAVLAADAHAEHSPPETVPLITESLAALYRRQGHLEAALDAYSQLVSRDPGNASLAARQRAVAAELAERRPLPFDVAVSGGQSVPSWLGAIAAARPDTVNRPAGIDEFYQTPEPPREASDLDAFQRWLEELDR